MNTPNLTTKRSNGDYYGRWQPVVNGDQAPDEWQIALIKITEEALAAGLYYSREVNQYIRDNAEFVPAEYWDLQYESQPVEDGVMGMECYMARSFISESKRRASNAAALEALPIGLKVGTLAVNGKKYTGLTVTEYKNNQIYLVGKAGRYQVRVWTEPSAIETMKQRAISRGWRKS